MLFGNKQYTIQADKYFQLKKPTYTYVKLVSTTSVRNYKTNDIAEIINNVYVDIVKRFKKENKGFSYTLPSKVSFVVDITKDSADFYIIVPDLHLKEFKQELTSTFGKITLEEVSDIPHIKANCTKYSLEYAKDDSLSLKIDKRDNDLLSDKLGLMSILQGSDRLTIVYNFIPQSKLSLNAWKNYHQDMIRKYNQGVSLDKQLTIEKVLSLIFKVAFGTLDSLFDAFESLFNSNSKPKESTMSRLMPVQELTKNTLEKENATIVNTQIMIYSQSDDKNREDENVKALINTYNKIGKDNKLMAKKVTKTVGIKKILISKDEKVLENDEKTQKNTKKITKVKKVKRVLKKKVKKTNVINPEIVENDEISSKFTEEINVIDLDFYDFNVHGNKMSCDELSNFISLPGRELIDEHNLEAVKHTETIIPEELQGGSIRYGDNTYRGSETTVTTSTNTDASCMPVVIMSKMGGGKTSLFENMGVDGVNSGEGLLVMDNIKNCEMSDNIIKNIDSEKVVVINFSDYMCQEGFGFNEINMLRDPSNPMSRYECASLQTNQIVAFVDNLGDEPFSASMNRFLDAACMAVFIHEDKSLKDVIKCLECYQARMEYVELLEEFAIDMPEEYRDLIHEDINSLKELNETKAKSTDIVGTKTTKIDGILSRIFLLRRNPSLKFMYTRSTKNNINLAECMQQGKAIFFKLPQSKFSSPIVKNVMISYLYSKVMVASEVRAEVYKDQELTVVNVICDEIQQARGAFANIDYMSYQMRKFRVRLTISCHGFHTIAPIKDTLKEAGATIMLLKGSSVKNFEYMQDEFEMFGFTKDDLVGLSRTKEYKALCLIATQQGRYGAMVRLPKPVNGKIEERKIQKIEEVEAA